MKASIRGNEKVVIKVWINKKHYWQYTARPEDPNVLSPAKMADYINDVDESEEHDEFITSLKGELALKSVEQFIFVDHSMDKMLAEALEDAEDEEVRQEVMFLQDLYDSKFPLTQNEKTDIIPPELRKDFHDMGRYSHVLPGYITEGLLRVGLLTFSAELKK